MKKLKLYQYNIVSRFCEDIAKALAVAVVLGQIAITAPFQVRILLSIATLSVSLIMLYFAIYFSKEGHQ